MKEMIQQAISPLISQITELKAEVNQLTKQLQGTPQKPIQRSTQESIQKAAFPKVAPAVPQIPQASQGKKTLVEKKKGEPALPPTVAIPIAKPTFADMARAKTADEETWIKVQHRTKARPLVQQLAPKKATEPSERRVIFTRDTFLSGQADMSDLLLAINLAIKKAGLPDHVRFFRMSYTTTGAISGLLGDRATAGMLCPAYNTLLINTARALDPAIIGVQKAEQWHKLRIHKVSLKRYLAGGLKLAR